MSRLSSARRALVLAATCAVVAAARQPNLVVLLLDDQDSLLGSGLDVMPHYTQRFVNEGLRLSNAFAASPKCCASSKRHALRARRRH